MPHYIFLVNIIIIPRTNPGQYPRYGTNQKSNNQQYFTYVLHLNTTISILYYPLFRNFILTLKIFRHRIFPKYLKRGC